MLGEAASQQSARRPGILDRDTQALQQEVESRSAISRSGHEADEFVIETAVEKHGQERDLGAGATRHGEENHLPQ